MGTLSSLLPPEHTLIYLPEKKMELTPLKILVFPKYSNPYQNLLYTAMENEFGAKVKIRYVRVVPHAEGLSLFIDLLIRRLCGYRILHIHWPDFVLHARWLPFRRHIAFSYFSVCLFWIRKLGFSVIWTVHNVTPHERISNRDDLLMQRLSLCSSAKIVHSQETINQMREMRIDTSNTHIIGIGSYAGIYPHDPSITRRLGTSEIASSSPVFLFFGMIRLYKGVELLIEYFEGNSRAHLLIAGPVRDATLALKIKHAARGDSITFLDRYIPDNEVAMIFSSADVVCLPFQQMTTTSSALLGMAFGKPIVAPRIGMLVDVPSGAGIFYDPVESSALFQTLDSVIEGRFDLKSIGEKAKKYSDELSWNAVAEDTMSVYLQSRG